ncbi:MAG: adenylate/guanylate cyclase domain-containing protein [Proteobacteria bacterium]|nr:adenylate/guanylate cyclase domain-containing protein [Pseudomonadota bacterium]
MGANTETTQEDRKLTTILCADVVGYSRLMSHNETETLRQLKQTREVFRAFIEQYGGRIINMAGDGLIADFSSVVNAVHCAIETQNKINDDSKAIQDDTKMLYRIGLNLGDVIIEGDDIFGEGVNVAARLEAMAPTGGICISGTVFDQVKNKLPQSMEFLGEKTVKNISEPIPVYSIALTNSPDESRSGQASSETTAQNVEDAEDERIRKQVQKESAFYRLVMTFGAISVFLFIINMATSSGYWWFLWPTGSFALMLALRAIPIFWKGSNLGEWEERKVSELKAKKKRQA